ncbi:hypothetical protein GBAR_LOCUS12938 [Geodia barretti]|uniref:Uncharacterized protein n=1 Tax=Geodia barretti TaxID=519541 RepID=A0AA35S4D6_GEOBA|nr:hypothetical protein GBAR_LOCUS12938 [Geodia barretti]
MEVQSHIDYADQLWMSLEQNHPFLKRENTGIQEKRKQLQRGSNHSVPSVATTVGKVHC